MSRLHTHTAESESRAVFCLSRIRKNILPWNTRYSLWGNIVTNPIDGEIEVGSHDNGGERTDCDLADQAVGKLAHDELVGGEAQGGQDGEGQHHRHQDVQDTVQVGYGLQVSPEDHKR